MEKKKQTICGEEDFSKGDIINKILKLLCEINDYELLFRIYRFTQYIYIHKT